jgi:hypothetical protein
MERNLLAGLFHASASLGSAEAAAALVDADDADAVALFAHAQAAKAFVNDHPLARADRDVRAGSFMHPLGANRAYELLGDVALGRDPILH